LWADSQSANFGVRVLAEGMANLARAAWGPNIEVEFQNFGAGDSEISFYTRSIARDIGRRNGPIKSKLRQYDLILDSGAGDSFTDIYGLKRLSFMFYAQRTASRLGIPVIMGPQTIGPFNTTLGRWAASRSLRTMDGVIARDPRSAECAEDLGRKVDALATDVVFALGDPPRFESRDVLLNISGLLWFGDAHIDSSRYRRELIELVAGLQDQGRKVSLIAHVVSSARGNHDDDVDAVKEFQREHGTELEVILPSTLEHARSALAGANFVIGSRMHACLNALSAGTPAIAWAYSRKFAPLMSDIGWNYVIDLANPATNPATETLKLIGSSSQADFEMVVLAVRKHAQERLNAAVSALSKVVGIDDHETDINF
jgi:polysaccharide pyruvyl transferase WcaK-like protein